MHVVRVRERRVVVVAREDVPNDAKEEELQHDDDEWVRLLGNAERISVQLSGIAVSTVHGNVLETETRPLGGVRIRRFKREFRRSVLPRFEIIGGWTRKVRDNWEERGGEGG